MAITNLNNPAINARPRLTTKDILNFSTDAVAGITTTGNISFNGNGFTFASTTGFAAGDAITVATGDAAGTGDWHETILNVTTGTAGTLNIPGVQNPSGVTGAAISRWEKIAITLRPKKVILRNLTNLDEYIWEKGMASRSAIYQLAAGGKSLVTGKTLWITSAWVFIHPAILIASQNWQLELEY